MFQSRRELLGRLGLLGVASVAPGSAVSAAEAQPPAMTDPRRSHFDVRRFGAKADGTTDDTPAFQKALAAAGRQGGGVVLAAAGNYLLAGHLNFPQGVALRGDWLSVPSHNGLREDAGRGLPAPASGGTTLLATGGAGQEDAPPLISLADNCTLQGVVIYYPHQVRTAPPVVYPWTIFMRGLNPAVVDVELVNPYRAINATLAPRFLVRNVVGQPLRMGVWLDEIYDIGRLENVHFNPIWSYRSPVYDWQQAHGEGFVFGKADWLYALNTFCFGYNRGYRFIATKAGACNGNFLGIGADNCNTCVWIDRASRVSAWRLRTASSYRSPGPIQPPWSLPARTRARSASSTAPSGAIRSIKSFVPTAGARSG